MRGSPGSLCGRARRAIGGGGPRGPLVSYWMSMTTIDERDYQILLLIYRFKQLTAHHIQSILSLSKNPCYKSLNRLKANGYIYALEQPLVGGARGGSSQYVWSIAPAGWKILTDNPYRPARSINYHTLEVATTMLQLVELSRAGNFTIERYAVESEAWFTVDNRPVKPDLYLETRGASVVYTNLEVDRGSEGETQIKRKLSDYVYAIDHVNHAQFPVFPRTVWVAIDKTRAAQLRRIIGHLSEDDRQLFKVCEHSNIVELF